MIHKPLSHIITGAPGTGKTTLIKELEKRGFLTVKEGTRDIIESILEEDSPYLPWKNREAFQSIIVQKRIEDYLSAPENQICFFDRGLPDEIAFYLKDSLEPSEECMQACENHKYSPTVFILQPWNEIHTTDKIRKESFEEAKKLHPKIRQTYHNQNYKLIYIPKTTVKKRAEFILKIIDKR